MCNHMKLWTQNAIADELGMDRRKIGRLLSGTKPDGKVNSRYEGYFLSTVIASMNPVFSEDGDVPSFVDPETLHPKDRKDWYDGEGKRIDIDQKLGQLIPNEIHRREMSLVISAILSPLDALGDRLERDAQATPEQVVLAEGVAESIREEMYARVIAIPED